MKRVLLVSPHPLGKTGRGMDVLTHCFAQENWDTTHLQFPFYPFSTSNSYSPEGIQRVRAKRALIPYVDSILWWLPGFIFRLLQRYTSSKVRKLDFSKYDLIVLESGKPLFLLSAIPDNIPILYRQSDSVKMVLGRGKHYCALEDLVCRRAEKIILVKDYYKESIPKEEQHKITVIKNGYNIPKNIELENPYGNERRKAVYVGLTPLDPGTLNALCKNYPELDIHIIGPCLRKKRHIRQLKKNKNFFFHGYVDSKSYLAYLKYADMAIFPFHFWKGMEHVGFTSKFFNFMYFSLPIVSYRTGDPKEFEMYHITLAEDKEDFIKKVGEVLRDTKKIDYSVDWDFYSAQGREAAYRGYIKDLNL